MLVPNEFFFGANKYRRLPCAYCFTVLHLLVTVIGVQIPLGGLALDVEVVRELALISLCAGTGLVEGAEDGLGVDAEGDLLLDLNGLEQIHELVLLGLLGTLAIDDGLLLTLLLDLLFVSLGRSRLEKKSRSKRVSMRLCSRGLWG